MATAQCYNKGCSQKFNPAENNEKACVHHPGEPVFHDALKGWSCCEKRYRDFTEFLNTPGCTKGPHNDVKPPEPVAEKNTPLGEKEIIVVAPLPKSNEIAKRPSETETKLPLKTTILSSLKSAIDKRMENMTITQSEKECGNEIKIGTRCNNGGCNKNYEGDESNKDECTYHPGTPVFHEGMKYWSCCQRKTSDFTSFLQQEGCSTGQHVWVQMKTDEAKPCRHDWHQTASHVTISVFSKNPVPDKCVFRANRVSCDLEITFDHGSSFYSEGFILNGVIDPSRSDVKLMGTKVEVNLRKAEPSKWPTLLFVPTTENGK